MLTGCEQIISPNMHSKLQLTTFSASSSYELVKFCDLHKNYLIFLEKCGAVASVYCYVSYDSIAQSTTTSTSTSTSTRATAFL